MKIRITFLIFCILAVAPAVFTQTTIKLFDPVAIAPTINANTPFATTKIYLSCPFGATGTVSGPNHGNLIVDDWIFLNGNNICPELAFGQACFNGTIGDPLVFAGQGAENGYNSVSPIDISGKLTPGTNLYTFDLFDTVYSYTSTELDLTTSCTQQYAVCHHDNGRRGMNTIFVDSLNAVNAHLTQHAGDTAGACGSQGQ